MRDHEGEDAAVRLVLAQLAPSLVYDAVLLPADPELLDVLIAHQLQLDIAVWIGHGQARGVTPLLVVGRPHEAADQATPQVIVPAVIVPLSAVLVMRMYRRGLRAVPLISKT